MNIFIYLELRILRLNFVKEKLLELVFCIFLEFGNLSSLGIKKLFVFVLKRKFEFIRSEKCWFVLDINIY